MILEQAVDRGVQHVVRYGVLLTLTSRRTQCPVCAGLVTVMAGSLPNWRAMASQSSPTVLRPWQETWPLKMVPVRMVSCANTTGSVVAPWSCITAAYVAPPGQNELCLHRPSSCELWMRVLWYGAHRVHEEHRSVLRILLVQAVCFVPRIQRETDRAQGSGLQCRAVHANRQEGIVLRSHTVDQRELLRTRRSSSKLFGKSMCLTWQSGMIGQNAGFVGPMLLPNGVATCMAGGMSSASPASPYCAGRAQA